jgi:hypothetical protein
MAWSALGLLAADLRLLFTALATRYGLKLKF